MQNHYLVGGKYRSIAYYMGLLFHVIPPAGCPAPPLADGGSGCSIAIAIGCPDPPGRDSTVSSRVAPSSFWLEGERITPIIDCGLPFPVPAGLADPEISGPCDLPGNIGTLSTLAGRLPLLSSPLGEGPGVRIFPGKRLGVRVSK
jgi:hypothetical protein